MGTKEKIGISAHLFEKIFEQMKPRCIIVARSYVRDLDVAKDIVHDSFMHLWEHRETIEDINIKGYVYSVIRTKCLNYLRSLQIGNRIEGSIHNSTWRVMEFYRRSIESTDPDTVFQDEIIAIVREHLARMPSLTREIFLDYRLEGMSYKALSEKYGISVRQVTNEIRYALVVLRVALKDYLPLIITLLTIKSK